MYRPFQHRLTVTDVPDLASGARVVVFEKVYKTNRGAVAARRRWLAGGAWSHRSATITTEPVGAERAREITEWLGHLHDAQRFGSREPHRIADVLTYGKAAPSAPAKQPATDCTQPASNEVSAAQKTGGTKGDTI